MATHQRTPTATVLMHQPQAVISNSFNNISATMGTVKNGDESVRKIALQKAFN
jgi:hypothetical protein